MKLKYLFEGVCSYLLTIWHGVCHKKYLNILYISSCLHRIILGCGVALSHTKTLAFIYTSSCAMSYSSILTTIHAVQFNSMWLRNSIANNNKKKKNSRSRLIFACNNAIYSWHKTAPHIKRSERIFSNCLFSWIFGYD